MTGTSLLIGLAAMKHCRQGPLSVRLLTLCGGRGGIARCTVPPDALFIDPPNKGEVKASCEGSGYEGKGAFSTRRFGALPFILLLNALDAHIAEEVDRPASCSI